MPLDFMFGLDLTEQALSGCPDASSAANLHYGRVRTVPFGCSNSCANLVWPGGDSVTPTQEQTCENQWWFGCNCDRCGILRLQGPATITNDSSECDCIIKTVTPCQSMSGRRDPVCDLERGIPIVRDNACLKRRGGELCRPPFKPVHYRLYPGLATVLTS